MHLSTLSTLPLLASTLAHTTIAHPIIFSPNQPHQLNPVAAAIVPLQDDQLQLLLPQQSGTQRLVITMPEQETLGWGAEKWAVAVRWWKVAVRGKVVKEEGAGWNGGGVSAGDWVGDGEEGVRVMEPIEEYEDAEEEEEMECDAVDEEDEGDDDDEEEDGQMEL